MSTTQVTLPRVALFNGSTLFFWTSGQKFNGFLLVNLILPTRASGVSVWPSVDYGNQSSNLELPLMQKIPIVAGQLNNSCGLFLNADITPPGSIYRCWYYDASGTLIAGPSTNFSVTSQDALTPPILPLTAPTGVSSGTNPD